MRLAKVFLLVLLVLLFESLISKPHAYAEEAKDTLWIEALKDSLPVDSLPLGISFRMSVNVSNLDTTLAGMEMNFAFQDTDLVRLDSFSFAGATCRLLDPDTMDYRDTARVTPDAIYIELSDTGAVRNYLPPGRGNIIDLWFTGIRPGDFFIDAISSSVVFYDRYGASIDPTFLTDGVTLAFYSDPCNLDSLWVKKGVEYDTIGINAKFPLPFTAYNDEILSGFEIPLLLVGNNLPTFYDRICFDSTSLKDTAVLSPLHTLDLDTLDLDSVLIRLELKKELTDTLLEPGVHNNLFNLWLQAADSDGKCDIYTDFVPHMSNLFFIDSIGGFTPDSSGIACTTFSYLPGDITNNGVANNVDLFYLAMHLFLPPNSTSSGELSFDPENFERIHSQRIFESAPISSEEWDSTFSQIQFRGDVNGDSRVDVGDFYTMSRFFQADTVETLKYGWFEPRDADTCEENKVKVNFRKAYPDQRIAILVEILNTDTLGAITIPLQISDVARIRCDSITLAGRFDTLLFDWEWITWNEDYDQDITNQDLLIIFSTLGTTEFPAIPPTEPGPPDSAFILWCTVKDVLLDQSYIEAVSFSPSHELAFFQTWSGHSCVPKLEKSVVDSICGDYGDAPDGTDPYFAPDSYYFPTLYHTECARIEGRRGPFHLDATDWLGTFSDTTFVTQEWNAIIPDMDEDNLSKILYLESDTVAWYITPVTVTSDTQDFRYLNVLYNVNGDSVWKNDEYKEWVVQNKLIIPYDTTEGIITGPFKIKTKPDSITAWARFTLTRDQIPADSFDSVGGWDGSGPNEGWLYGETEDILFDTSKTVNDIVCFSVSTDSSLYHVPAAGSSKVKVTIKLVGPSSGGIDGLVLSPQVFHTAGNGNPVTCDFRTCSPKPCGVPSSFGLGTDEHPEHYVVFEYDAYFPGLPNARISNVFWKVSYDSEVGTTLVASDEAEFEETAEPHFVFLYPSGDTVFWSDTTISYYGGVVDLRLSVVDPDSDYDITVHLDRSEFQGAAYPPTFGESKYSEETTVSSAHDAVTFLWATDVTEIDTRYAIFKAVEKDGQSGVETALTIHVSNADSLLPDSSKVWIGRTGVIGTKNGSFNVPVELYNQDFVETIHFPFGIGFGEIEFDSCSFIDSRCSIWTSHSYLDSMPDSVSVTLDRVGSEPYLPSNFGKIFDIWLTVTDTIRFHVDTIPNSPPTLWDGGEIYPAFQSYEITVIEELGEWICGDANRDNTVTIGDVVFLVNYVLKDAGPEPDPPQRGDVDCLGGVIPKIDDIVYIVNYLFRGGEQPKQCDYGCTRPPPPE